MAPIIRKTILANYSVSYSDWKLGGIQYELIQQEGFIGHIALMLMVVGIVYGIANKSTRNFSLRILISYFIIIFLFNRVQSM